jgi:hypothetical protein
MANEKITEVVKPLIHLDDFVNNLPEHKAGRVELCGAFHYFMEYEKKILNATEKEFKDFLEKFKKGV